MPVLARKERVTALAIRRVSYILHAMPMPRRSSRWQPRRQSGFDATIDDDHDEAYYDAAEWEITSRHGIEDFSRRRHFFQIKMSRRAGFCRCRLIFHFALRQLVCVLAGDAIGYFQ